MIVTKRLMGEETEYFFAVFLQNGQRGDPMYYLMKLIELARELYGAIQDSDSSGCYLPNGSRLYIDCGHPELGTCEACSPLEVLRYILAGDFIMSHLAQELKARCPEVSETVLCRCHVDYSGAGATWGAHESYMHRSESEALQRQLIPHLCSRLVYSGAGGLNSLFPGIQFQIEPRTPHIQHVTSNNSTRHRGIFHTKNEPLMKGGFGRLHLLTSATACSQTATFLRLGTTSLIVALTDLGKRPARDLQLADPLSAMRTFSQDITCTSRVLICDGKRLSAIELQREYLEAVSSESAAGNLPPWSTDVCSMWQKILDKLEEDPMGLADVLDWPLKLKLFHHFCAEYGMDWNSRNVSTTRQNTSIDSRNLRSRLCEIDVRFSELGDVGIFENLDRDHQLSHALLTREEIECACSTPPRFGRAKLRGKWISHLAGIAGAHANWQFVWDPRTKRRLELSNPFEEHEHWTPFPSGLRTQVNARVLREHRRAVMAARLAQARNRSDPQR